MAGTPPGTRWLFLGNYVNLGACSLEVMVLLLAFKAAYPHSVYLLRGPQEMESMCQSFGLYQDMLRVRRFSRQTVDALMAVFNALPVAALVDGAIFCAHGGINRNLVDSGLDLIRTVSRPCELDAEGVVKDLLWAVPRSEPGSGVLADQLTRTFGPDMVQTFCKNTGVQLLVRSGQLVKDGAMLFPNERVLNLWSASDYLEQFDIPGCVLSVDQQLHISILRHRVKKPQGLTVAVPLSVFTTTRTSEASGTLTGPPPAPDQGPLSR